MAATLTPLDDAPIGTPGRGGRRVIRGDASYTATVA